MKNILIFLILSARILADTFSVTDSRLIAGQSPSNSAAITLSGSVPAIRWENNGGYQIYYFTGTATSVNVDTSNLWLAGIGQDHYPWMSYSIDGIPIQAIQLTDDSGSPATITLASGLSGTGPYTVNGTPGYHRCYMGCAAIDGTFLTNTWNGSNGLTFTGINVDSGKTIVAFTPNVIRVDMYGDSILAGQYQVMPNSYYSFGAVIGRYLGGNYAQIGFPGTGPSVGFQGVPPFFSSPGPSYTYIYDGVNRPSFTADIVIIEEGTNTSGTFNGTDFTNGLADLRSRYGSSTYINVLMPFNQSNASALNSAYSAYTSAHPSDNRIMLIDLGATWWTNVGSPNTTDGTHLNVLGSRLAAEAIEPLLIGPIPGGGSTATASAVNVGTLSFTWPQ